jgi:hypothetical protein
MPEPQTHVKVFTLNKTTKNTYRYEAPEGGDVSGSIYLQKSAVGENPPQELQVNIVPVEG